MLFFFTVIVALFTFLGIPNNGLSAEASQSLDPSRFPAEVSYEVLYRQKLDGYNNIRIPAICQTRKGTLLAFAEGRVGGDSGNIDLILRRIPKPVWTVGFALNKRPSLPGFDESKTGIFNRPQYSADSGKTWQPQQVLWNDAENTCGNPTPVVDQDTGTIWLFCTWNDGLDTEKKIMEGKSRSYRRVFLSQSNDDGVTWTKPEEQKHLRKDDWTWYATGPCNGIQLERGKYKGRLVIPANHAVLSDTLKGSERYFSHVIYSDDHGKTWQLGSNQGPHTNESTVVELADGTVLQNMRSYHEKGCRAVAASSDGAQTFGPIRFSEDLVCPVCQGSCISCVDTNREKSQILLFSAPFGTKREKMSIWASRDGGKSWPIRKLIFDGQAAYSNLIVLPEGKIGLLCELGDDNPYRTITFVVVSLSWILKAQREGM